MTIRANTSPILVMVRQSVRDVRPWITRPYRRRRAVTIDCRRGGGYAIHDCAKDIARDDVVVSGVVAGSVLHDDIAGIPDIDAALILDDIVPFDPVARGGSKNTGLVVRTDVVANQAGAVWEADSFAGIG